MSTGGLILLGAFLAGSVAIILWPLIIQSQTKGKDSDNAAIESLQAQHETILAALRDLDFDKQTGKINPADYDVQRERLMQTGVEILKQIDSRESELIEAAVKEKRTVPKKERDRSSRKSKPVSSRP